MRRYTDIGLLVHWLLITALQFTPWVHPHTNHSIHQGTADVDKGGDPLEIEIDIEIPPPSTNGMHVPATNGGDPLEIEVDLEP